MGFIEKVRGILIYQGKIALIKRIHNVETYYVFPGQLILNDQLSFKELLKHFFLEELGLTVKINNLYLKNDVFNVEEYFYSVTLTNDQIFPKEIKTISKQEKNQSLVWIDLNDLPTLNLKPNEVRNQIIKDLKKEANSLNIH